jgi:hypothetical protein
MPLNEISKTNPDWLTSFLCPVVADNFCFHRSVFNIENLQLDFKSSVEISHSTSETKMNLTKAELIQLENIDPHHKIVNYVNGLLVQFSHTIYRHFRIRIEFINHDQCTLFHTDNVKLRLVQTLWGRSTEVIESKYANYDGIGKGRNELIVFNNELIKTVPKDHFILMKGSRWSDGFKGCIHKSPEIEIHQERRLLIVIDFDEQPLRNHSGICDV